MQVSDIATSLEGKDVECANFRTSVSYELSGSGA